MHARTMLSLALGIVSAAEAQTMRTTTIERQARGETRLLARLAYSAGSLRVLPAGSGTLYRMTLAYDADRFTPVSVYDAGRGEVTLGVRSRGGSGFRTVARDQLRQGATIALSPDVTLRLDATLGAAESELELGGLRLEGLAVRTGASRSTIRFSVPSQIRCDTATFETGAAELAIVRLGNASCAKVEIDGSVGKVDLDLGGNWQGNAEVDVRLTLGEVTLRIPSRLGVELALRRFLTDFEPDGLIRRGNSFVTPGYDAATRKVLVRLSSTLGGVSIVWTQ